MMATLDSFYEVMPELLASILQMLANAGEKADVIKFFTFFTLFDVHFVRRIYTFRRDFNKITVVTVQP